MIIKLKTLLKEVFKKKKLLREGYSLNVVGARDEYPDLSNMLSLSYAIMYNSLKPLESMTEEERMKFDDGHAMDILTPDGGYESESKGVLNFYTMGIPERLIPSIINNIKEQLENIGIPFGEFKKERSKMRDSDVIRIPILDTPEYQGPPKFHVSQFNAKMLFTNLLGFKEKQPQYYSFTVDELNERLNQWLDMDDTARKGALARYLKPTTVDKKDGHATFITGGVNYKQILNYFIELKKVVDWANQHGYKHLSAT